MTHTWLDVPLPASYFADTPTPIHDAVTADEGPATNVIPLRGVA